MKAEELEALLRGALERAGEPEADAYASFARRGFARFFSGEIGQHMDIEEPVAVVRVARGKRVAEVTAPTLDEPALVAALHEAAEMAPQVPEDASFPGFSAAPAAPAATGQRFFESTHRFDANARVDRLRPVLESIERAGLCATGTLDTTSRIEAVATSHGLSRSYSGTIAVFKAWALESAGAGGASGHGMSAHADIDRLSLAEETERAIEDALRSKNPRALPAGKYDTVLAPLALAELIEWLGMIGLGAREFEQGLSPLSGKIGERISGDAMTISEDPLGELALAAPFDREGESRRQVTLIEAGIGRAVLHDRATAARNATSSTGSAGPPWAYGAGGPTPTSLVMAGGGAKNLDALIANVEKGLLVRRLHYVNGYLEPRRAVMTGLTRDGTFWIENGKIAGSVGSMRFTDSLLEAFARASRPNGLTASRTLVPNWWSTGGTCAAPGVLLPGLTFTSESRAR